MNKEIIILAICKSPEMCNLMKKYFDKHENVCNCVKLCNSPDEESIFVYEGIKHIEKEPDCIIYDEELGDDIISHLKRKFNNSIIYYLPALTEPGNIHIPGTRIPEPFKLSELENILNGFKEIRKNVEVEKK